MRPEDLKLELQALKGHVEIDPEICAEHLLNILFDPEKRQLLSASKSLQTKFKTLYDQSILNIAEKLTVRSRQFYIAIPPENLFNTEEKNTLAGNKYQEMVDNINDLNDFVMCSILKYKSLSHYLSAMPKSY